MNSSNTQTTDYYNLKKLQTPSHAAGLYYYSLLEFDYLVPHNQFYYSLVDVMIVLIQHVNGAIYILYYMCIVLIIFLKHCTYICVFITRYICFICWFFYYLTKSIFSAVCDSQYVVQVNRKLLSGIWKSRKRQSFFRMCCFISEKRF